MTVNIICRAGDGSHSFKHGYFRRVHGVKHDAPVGAQTGGGFLKGQLAGKVGSKSGILLLDNVKGNLSVYTVKNAVSLKWIDKGNPVQFVGRL